MKRGAESAKVFSKDMNKLGAQATQLGASLTKTLTLPILGIGGAALKASMDFETAFAGVKKTIAGTPEQMAKLNSEIRELAKTTPVSAAGIAQIAESAGQLGVGRDKVAAFTKTIIDISTATNLTAEEAGTAFAKLANVMHVPQDQFANLGSAVYQLGNFGASTEQEMLGMAQRIAAAGASAGLTAPQVLGISNALASVGIEAEAGGTAVSRVITKIATDVASGSGHLADFAKVAGMSSKDFQAAWGKDAGAALAMFFQGLANVKDKGESLFNTMDELGFKEVRLKNAMLSAANAGDLMAQSIKLGNEAFRDTTKFTAAAEERFKTTANQLKILWNRITDVGITLGNALKPAMDDAIKLLERLLPLLDRMAQTFAGLPAPVRDTAIALGLVAAAAGPALLIFGQLAFAGSALAKLFTTGGLLAGLSKFVSVAGFGSTAVAALGTAFEILTGPIGWIVGITAAVLTATGTWGDFFRILKAGAEIIKNVVVAAFREFIIPIFGGFLDIGKRIAGFIDGIFGISTGIKFLGDTFRASLKWAADFLEALEMISAIDIAPNVGGPKGVIAEPAKVKDAWKALEEYNAAQAKVVTGAANLSAELKQAQADLAGLTEEQRRNISAGLELNKSVNDISESVGASEAVIGLFKDRLAASKKALEDNTKALKEMKDGAEDARKEIEKLSADIGKLQDAVDAEQFAEELAGIGREIGFADSLMGDLQQSSDELEDTLHDIYGLSGQITSRWKESAKAGSLMGTALGKVPGLIAQGLAGGGGLKGGLKASGASMGADLLGGFFGTAGHLAADGSKVLGTGLLKNLTGVFGKTLSQVMPAVGALIGPAIDGLIKLFGDHAGKDLKKMGKQWGVDLSENLIKQLKEDAGKFGGEFQALLINLDKVIGEAGGVAAFGVDKAIGKLHDVFSLVQRHQLSVTQATKIIDKNFGEIAAAGTDSYGRISAKIKELINLNDEFKTKSAAIADFLKGQGGNALSGFAGVAGAATPYAELKKSVTEARKAVADLAADGKQGTEDWKTANATLTKALGDLAKVSGNAKEELADLGIQAVASFSAAVAAGVPWNEALKQIGPSLQTLKDDYDALGLGIEDVALKTLLTQSTMATANPELMAGIAGLSQEFIALDNLSALTPETFAAMERTGTRMFDRLKTEAEKAGGSATDALLPMQDYLHQAEDAAKKYGFAIDEGTQALIDQSKQQGIWKEEGESANDIMIEGFSAIILALGGEIPKAWQHMADEAKKAADKAAKAAEDEAARAQAAFDHLVPPDLTGTYSYDFGGFNGDFGPYPQPEGFASGSGGIRDFGSGTPAILHGREGVYTEAQIAAMRASGGMNVTNNFYGPVLAEDAYIEQHVVAPVLSGIRRYNKPEFDRLVDR